MRGLRILFATIAPLRQGPAGPTSDLASARYRVLIPAQQLARLGHQVQIATLPDGGWPAAIRDAACDVLVISKSFHPHNEELARAVKARGARVAVDFCDDHFAHPQHGAHFHNLATLADRIVASTEAMAQAVRRHTSREAVVISDPVEGPRGVPRFEPRLPALRLAWFGHPTNLNGLLAKAGELHALAARMPVRLSIVTAPVAETTVLLAKLVEGHESRIQAELVPWSLEATWKTLAGTDATWIPVADSQGKAVKSPNRLLESAWAGRLAVADPVPAYMPFADLTPIGDGLERGIMKALEDPATVVSNLGEMQQRIARSHSAFACGGEWAAALEAVEQAARG
jgi:hypothetical protein